MFRVLFVFVFFVSGYFSLYAQSVSYLESEIEILEQKISRAKNI